MEGWSATGFLREKTPLSRFRLSNIKQKDLFNENQITVLGDGKWKEVARLSLYAINKARFYFCSLGVLKYTFKNNLQDGNFTAHKWNFKKLTIELKKFSKEAKILYKKILESKNIEQIIKQGSKDYYDKYYL